MSQVTNKLLIVGWDGATFDVIRPMVARGELPHLARLMTDGTHGVLRSTVPPSSAVAWPTFMTGREPAGHGIFGFFQTDGRSYRPRLVSSYDLHVPCFWDWLGQAGYQVGVVNLPLTYPPRPLHGFLVSGMLTPGADVAFTYPPELRDELLSLPVSLPFETDILRRARAARKPLQAIQILQQWTEDFHTAVRYLLTNKSWNCFTVIYRATDMVQHALGFLWHRERLPHWAELAAKVGEDGIERVYRQLDTCLGDLLEHVPSDTTVLVLSDHGFAPAYGCFYLNNWLYQMGYLSVKRGARYRRWLMLSRRIPFRRVLARLGLNTLALHLPARLANLPIPVPEIGGRQIYHMIDWRRTRVYMPFIGSSHALNLRLNLKGREPKGIVSIGNEGDALLDELNQNLTSLRDEQGKQFFQRIMISAQNSADLVSNRGPDISALPIRENYRPAIPLITADRKVFTGPPRGVGQHWIDGVLIAHGPAIKSGAVIDKAHLVDVAPTVLHLMGLPVPAEMDGRVLIETLKPDWLATNPVQKTSKTTERQLSEENGVYSSQERTSIEDALRALGYFE